MAGAKKMRGLLGAIALAAMMVLLPAMHAHAQPATGSSGTSSEVCTDFTRLAQNVDSTTTTTPGILTNITNFIKPVVSTASQSLFSAFTSNANYQSAVNAAVTLMIVIYGVAFTIGVVQPSFGQLLVRLVKVGIIYAVISPSGWTFFSQYVVTFFNDGTDELIGGVMQIGTGIPFAPGDSPFKALDGIAQMVLSPDMIIAVIGSFMSGPYGLMMGGLLSFAVMGMLRLLLSGLTTYAVSFIVRALLLGVAPIFIVFLLFDKTKQLFTGWLNSLINLSLKPILYFTFISFFIVMMQGASKDMLGGAELCWTAASSAQGTQNKISGWRFKVAGQNAPITEESTWKGTLSCQLGTTTNPAGKCPEFPVNILDILSFLILVYVAQRFSSIIDRLANDIASVSLNLSADTKHLLNTPSTGDTGSTLNKQASKAPPATVKR